MAGIRLYGVTGMHLGIISTIKWHPWGGSEELWASTAKLARREGVKVSACCIRPRIEHPKWRELEDAGVQMFHAPSQGFLRNQLTSRAAALSYRLSEHFREQERLASLRAFFASKPDVVLINEGGGIPDGAFLGMLRTVMPDVPYIVLCHGNFGTIPPDEWRAETVRFFTRADASLFVAEATMRATERNLATRLPNGRIIRNPVNLDGLQAEPWPTEGCLRFACLGYLDVCFKGQDVLLEALSHPQWLQRDWRLSFYGAGAHKNYLRELAGYYGLSDRVDFCGETRDIRAVWRSHHALVVASRAESAPLVIVEAMLCGRPVIATDVGGIREWVQEGRSGFLAAAATAESLAGALGRAWHRRGIWPAMGATAHEDAIRMYDPNPAGTLLALLSREPKAQPMKLARAAAS